MVRPSGTAGTMLVLGNRAQMMQILLVFSGYSVHYRLYEALYIAQVRVVSV